jgi:hypothetical protein
MVPLFITTGERIRIDTRTDSYLGREWILAVIHHSSFVIPCPQTMPYVIR